MAIRSSKKKSATSVRHPVHRREQQIQGFNDEEVQTLKAIIADVQKALDTYGNSRPQRPGGSIWADLYSRSGAFLGTIYYALPEQLLSKIGVLDVRVEPSSRSIPRSGGKDQPVNSSALSGGLSTDASAGLSEHLNYLAGSGVPKVSGRRGTLHNGNGGWECGGSKRGSRGNKVPTNRKRSRVSSR